MTWTSEHRIVNTNHDISTYNNLRKNTILLCFDVDDRFVGFL
jgi:hypothetical protein